jgi:hypothetical protein
MGIGMHVIYATSQAASKQSTIAGMNGGRLALLMVLAVAGCGRSSLIGFDNGCPPNDPSCPPPDFGRPDGNVDGNFDGRFDGNFDGNLDGPKDGSLDGPKDGSFDGPKDGSLDGPKDGGLDGCVPTSSVENCTNEVDDNCNGLVDCQESTCQPLPVCINMQKEQCTNKIDDDKNGFIDCLDPACFGDKACIVPGQEICNNKLDDDDDGFVDCADLDCMGSPACKPNMGMEICDNGIDDNNDKLVDCSDPQCVTFPACLTTVCDPEVFFDPIQPHDSSSTRTLNTVGALQAFQTCASPGGRARVGQFTVTAKADVRLDFAQPAGAAHVVSVFRAGVGQACDQNLVFCLNAGQMATATHTFAALAAGTYWVVVQSFPGTQGSTTVKLSTGPLATPEICNNGVDDDKNGLIDCADLSCIAAPNCTDVQCVADHNLGTLIVDGPSKQAIVNTTTSSNRFHPTCAGTSTGNDGTVSFSLPETAGILVQWNQTGDHAFGLFQFPPPGQKCDAIQQSCYYPGGGSGGAVAFSARPAGKYVFVFKAIGAGKEGILNIRISAFKNRMVEICTNGIDDDGNGLKDCDDPACFGIGNCKAPLCMPDVDLGDFVVGTVKSTTVDTASGTDLYKTTCGKGNGKERVIRVSINQPMALGYQCNGSGSHVLQLSRQLMPLDSCDLGNFNCADPGILPFGCNFAMPSIQPGKYNIIVEAFQSGQEGTVNLTLFGIQQNILEICNNGIDDDQDGATDCNDLKCVTSADCAKFVCRADQKMGLLPLDGSTTSVVVQTTNAGDDQLATPCVTGVGGKDAVVDFTLPAKADLTIDWAQVGNHAFSLYTNPSDLLACDAGLLVRCTASMGVSTGKMTFTGLAQGKYHLVVDADKPGSEGGVAVQFSGFPAP